MGTKSLTVIKDTKSDTEICVIYKHWDGSPQFYGEALAKYLKDKKIVNGIVNSDKENRKSFNGMNEVAACILSEFKKDRMGDIYLYPSGTRDINTDYIYFVEGQEGDDQCEVIAFNYDSSKKYHLL